VPILTAELKNPLTGQTVQDARQQYMRDRDPREPIFDFKRRTLVHFAVDALRWYRGDDKIRIMVGRVLGPIPIDWMPMAEKVQAKLPPWIIAITNSRLIVSRTGAAFLVDCGIRRVARSQPNGMDCWCRSLNSCAQHVGQSMEIPRKQTGAATWE